MDKPEQSKINVETDLPNFPPGPLDQYRAQASFDWKRMKLFIEDERLLKFKVSIHPIYIYCFQPLTLIILLYEYDASLSLKYAIPFGFFFNALLALGQPKHLEFLDAANKEEVGTRDISLANTLVVFSSTAEDEEIEVRIMVG
uniref:Uncharacterized protein n=1 Tax=Timema monikensis TaxID=170555 RepID=A0A7R9E746_9NEOP|nr:unnamed protein product [Timema monikensis]